MAHMDMELTWNMLQRHLVIVTLVSCVWIAAVVHAQDEYSETVDDDADDKWINRDRYDYSFETDLLSFDNALARCVQEDGQLVYIADEEENAWIHGKRPRKKEMWIGMKRLGGHWVWLEEEFTSDYKHFRGGQEGNRGEACAAFGDNRATWDSFDCDVPRAFICKRKVDSCTPNPCLDHEECRVIDGDDYECICHHCPSDAEVFFAKWTSNTLLLTLLILFFILVVAVTLICCCVCIRGCFENGRNSPARRNRKGKYNVKQAEQKQAEKQALTHNEAQLSSIEIDTVQKPKIAPKPTHYKSQSNTSHSLTDSARGRSQSSSESDSGDLDDHKMAVSYEVHNTADRGMKSSEGNFYTSPPGVYDSSV